jgi:hypothetical protein
MNAVMYYGDEWDIHYRIKLYDKEVDNNDKCFDMAIG